MGLPQGNQGEGVSERRRTLDRYAEAWREKGGAPLPPPPLGYTRGPRRGAKPCTGGHSRGGAGAALTRPCSPLARATQDALGVLSRAMPGGAAVRQQTVIHMPRARGLQCGAGRKRRAVLTGFGSRCWPWGLEALCGGLGAGWGPGSPTPDTSAMLVPLESGPQQSAEGGGAGGHL